ncbi:MAG TPA: tetratricopeptide repeat protein [Rhodanobacter sp.]
MSQSERLGTYLAQDPGNGQLACDLLDALLAEGDFRRAASALQGLPDSVAAQPGIRFRAARIALATGDYGDAEETLARLREQGHRSAAIEHDIAFAQLCRHRIDAARATVDAAVAGFGTSPELCVLSARIALMEQDYAQAIAVLEKALALEPGYPVAWGLHALALLDAGEPEQAERMARACLSGHPDQHEALLAAATAALWRNDVDAAEADYRRALQRFPNSGRALSGLGQVLMLRGQLQAAMPQLRRAAETMPEHIGTWHALGWAQLLLGDLAGAENSYARAYDIDRNFAESHGGLAVVAMLAGRMEEGEAGMRRALRLDPNCSSGRFAKSLWMEHDGDEEGAAQLLAQVMREGAMPGATPEQARTLSRGIRERIHAGR